MNTIDNIPLLKVIIVGVITGLFSGVFGIGGGLVLIPMLVFVFGFPQKVASATSLIAIGLMPAGALGVYEYYKTGVVGNAHLKLGIMIGAGVFAGAFFGAKIANALPMPWLQRGFALLMVFGAARLWMVSLR